MIQCSYLTNPYPGTISKYSICQIQVHGRPYPDTRILNPAGQYSGEQIDLLSLFVNVPTDLAIDHNCKCSKMTDSQSSLSASISSLALPAPPPGSVPPAELYHSQQQWLRVEHPPSKRRGVLPSKIWEHGHDYISVTNPELHAWRCNYCVKDYLVIFKSDSTTNTWKHLRRVHGVEQERVVAQKRSRGATDIEENASESPQIRGLIQTVNIDTFRYHLVRWIVERHIPFTVVEDTNFQAMMKSLNGGMKDYLIQSGDTIRNWCEWWFYSG